MKALPYRCIYERHGRWSGLAAGAAWPLERRGRWSGVAAGTARPSESLSTYIVLLKPRAIRMI